MADEAGATVVLDAGDDTSTGETWEEFSLDSLDKAFSSFDDPVFVAGNHDNGTFVSRDLQSLGWTHLDGKPVEPFADVRMTGVDDLARAARLLARRERTQLRRGARPDRRRRLRPRRGRRTDRHADGPRRQPRAYGAGPRLHRPRPRRPPAHAGRARPRASARTGRSATATPTGRPAGRRTPSRWGKIRRDAEFTFVTYRDGRPVGIQPVTVDDDRCSLLGGLHPLNLDDDGRETEASRQFHWSSTGVPASGDLTCEVGSCPPRVEDPIRRRRMSHFPPVEDV